jgi:hypothetical protein
MKVSIEPNSKLAESQRHNNQTDSERIGELSDNGIDAGATRIRIYINSNLNNVVTGITHFDNGSGMSLGGVQEAFRFGSIKSNKKEIFSYATPDEVHYAGILAYPHSLGGFGNAQKAIAGKLQTVITKTKNSKYVYGRYNVSEIVADGFVADIRELDGNKDKPLIEKFRKNLAKGDESGTLIEITDLDLTQTYSAAKMEDELISYMGDTYCYFLKKGLEIYVNDKKVLPIDIFIDKKISITEEALVELDISGIPSRIKVVVGYIPKNIKKNLLHPLQQPSIKNQDTSVYRNGRKLVRAFNFFKKKETHNSNNRFRMEIFFEGYSHLDVAFRISPQKNSVKATDELIEQLWEVVEPMIKRVKTLTNLADKNVGVVRNINIPNAINKSLNRQLSTKTVSISDTEIIKAVVKLASLPKNIIAEITSPDMDGEMTINLSKNHEFYKAVADLGNPSRVVIMDMLIAMAKAKTEILQRNPEHVNLFREFDDIFSDTLSNMLSKKALAA